MACERKDTLVWRKRGWCALVTGMIAGCGSLKYDNPDNGCPAGTVEGQGSCDLIRSTADGGLLCDGPVACSDDARDPDCDWETPQQRATLCGQGHSSRITSSQCDDGYTKIQFSGTYAPRAYYYRNGSLAAVVYLSANDGGSSSCGEGPALFQPPTCGSPEDVCPSVDDAGAEVSTDAGGE